MKMVYAETFSSIPSGRDTFVALPTGYEKS